MRWMSFDCPRCGASITDDLYGPCPSCRSALRARFDGAPRADVEAAAYEPKMNVVPNAVASKE